MFQTAEGNFYRAFLIVLLTVSTLSILAPMPPVTAQTLGGNISGFTVGQRTLPGASTSPCLTPSPSDLSTSQEPPSALNGTVAGNTVPIVASQNATYESDLQSSTTLNLELVFALRNRDQFQKCLEAISDPTSPSYGKFLNATTLAPYLPTPGQKASVTSYLQQRGFVVAQGPSPLVLNFSAPVSAVRATFSVKISRYSQGNYSFYAANTDPALPQNYAALVAAVLGLDNFTRVVRLESPCSGPYCPQGIQVGYSINSLYSQGFDGSGMEVAITDEPGDANIHTAVSTFDAQYGLKTFDPTVIFVGGTPPNLDAGWAAETAMDVEAVHSIAPGAGIALLYDNTGDPMNAVDYVAQNHVAKIVSNSWAYACLKGSCSDTQLPSSFVSGQDSRLALDAAQGLTILFASGDRGARPDGTNFGTEFPASDPNVLAVGATNLVLSGCGASTCSGYSSETGASISGGGYSGFFSEPTWQTSTIGVKKGRSVPDVSMLGYNPGFWVYSTLASFCGGGSGGGWFGCSGTSLSTPLWAGFLAIALQIRNGVTFGNIDPLVYQLGSSSGYGSDFHDILSGINGYSAGVGWDPVTGWGSPVGPNLAFDLAPVQIAISGGVTLNQGDSATTQVTVSFASSQSRLVTLGCISLPDGTSCTFSPQSGNVDFTSTLTVNSATWVRRGIFNVQVVASPGTTSTANFVLEVDPHPTQNCAATSLPQVFNCPLSFTAGWNLVSLPVVPLANGTFSNTVGGIFGSDAQQGFLSNVTSVFTYVGGTWQFCTVTKQISGANIKYSCSGTLTNLVDGKGYWLYAKTAFNLNYASNQEPTWGGLVGSIIPPVSLPPTYSLTVGWNLIGFKPQPIIQSESVSDYLSSIAGSYDTNEVWTYDNTSGNWIRAAPSDMLAPGQALWILVTVPATLRP